MNTKQYTHSDICTHAVRSAYGKKGWGKAGRVVSGLLKAGKFRKTESHGRVTGSTYWYHLTDEQLASIRAEAIARAPSLRAQLCTPMTVGEASIAASTVL